VQWMHAIYAVKGILDEKTGRLAQMSLGLERERISGGQVVSM
jgi:hypothetical protein